MHTYHCNDSKCDMIGDIFYMMMLGDYMKKFKANANKSEEHKVNYRSAVAEMEHENITVQFMAARMQKLMSGGWPGRGVPYGYVSANKELVVVPEAADLVRLIYQKYLEPDMKREDKVITSDFVSSVLGNPVYYGMIVYNRRTNSEEIKRNPKEIIKVQYWLALNYFRLEDAGTVFVRGAKDKGDVKKQMDWNHR